MKKYQKISIILAALLTLLASIVFAATENESNLKQEAEILTESAVSSVVSSSLSPITDDIEVKKIDKFEDKMLGKEITQGYTDNYIVKIDSTSKQLIGIYEKESKYNLSTTSDKQVAESFIREKYNEMNLPQDYKLVYIEKFDTYVWEADFQKEYSDGVYNMYEAVKVFFNPENKEIVALTIFNEPYQESSNEIITSEEAENIAINSLEKVESIKKSELTLIKANNFYDNSKEDKSIHKAYVLTTQDDGKVFVDAASGEIIGGDSFNG